MTKPIYRPAHVQLLQYLDSQPTGITIGEKLTHVLLSYFDFRDLLDRLSLERRRAGAVHLVQELSHYHI